MGNQERSGPHISETDREHSWPQCSSGSAGKEEKVDKGAKAQNDCYHLQDEVPKSRQETGKAQK
jgi:hypothetical protein